jgi:hypothetical protein
MTSGWVARMRCSGLATMASISGVVRWSANWRLKVGGHGIGPELKGKDAVGTLDAFLGRGNLQDRALSRLLARSPRSAKDRSF